MDLPIRLPSLVAGPVPANFYKWSKEGLCIGEQLDSLLHDSIKGLTIQEIDTFGEELSSKFALALEGVSCSWISNTHVQAMCGFLPAEECCEVAVIGFAFLISAKSERFLSDGPAGLAR